MSQDFSKPKLPAPARKAVGGLAFALGQTLVIRAATLLIRTYQLAISPAQTLLFGATGGCRFTPTCSQFALEAMQRHGALTGSALAAKRICRCQPWGGCGHDPVPAKRKTESGTIGHPVHS